MNIVAIIPARGGSKRIPQKNIISLAGKPLIAYTIEQAKLAETVNRVIVSTDDQKIAIVAKQYGAEVIKRPEHLAEDTTGSEAVLIQALDYLEHVENYHTDIVIFLQCTSPLRKKGDIDKAIEKYLEQKADSLFSAFRFNKYIWDIKDKVFTSINFDYKKERWREQDFPVQYQENGSIYILKPDILRKTHSRFGGKLAVYEMDYLYSFQVDMLEDLVLIETVLKKLEGENK